jgi:hypothetical protein
MAGDAYLVRKSQGDLEFVGRNVGVAPSLERACNGCWAYPEGSSGDAEGAHDGWRVWEDAIAGGPERCCG